MATKKSRPDRGAKSSDAHGNTTSDTPRAERRRQARQRTRRPSRWKVWGAPIAAAVVIVGLLVGAVLVSSAPDTTADTGGDDVRTLFAGIPDNDNILGDPKAPVLITEYVDPRCPVCRAFSEGTLPSVINEQVRTGKARLARRTWSILGPDSTNASLGFEAAARQGKLWPYSEVFFINQQPEDTTYATAEFLESVAREAGLDVDRFEQDLGDENALAESLFATQKVADAKGFTGTPAFVVSGPRGEKVFPGGAQPAGVLAQAVEAVGPVS